MAPAALLRALQPGRPWVDVAAGKFEFEQSGSWQALLSLHQQLWRELALALASLRD